MADGQITNADIREAAEAAATTIPRPIIEVGGAEYMRDAKGALVPVEIIKPADKLIDGEVRRIMGYAVDLSAQVARFKRHTLTDFANLMDLLKQEYGASLGGEKGNITLTSYDGLFQVRLQVADRLTFGPELQAAKALVDEYLTEATADAKPELRGIVTHAFNTDKAGLVNQAELFRLLRYEIADARWQSAMKAIKDSVRVEGTKEYVRFYRRDHPKAGWEAITIDVAAA